MSRSVRLVAGLPWVEISNVVDKLPWLEKDGIHFGFGFHVPQSTTKKLSSTLLLSRTKEKRRCQILNYTI